MILPTLIEGIIILLLLLNLFKSFNWNIEISREKPHIIFHPQGPQGAYFEIPDGIDPNSLQELFAEASRGLANAHREHNKPPPDSPQNAGGGYV